MEDKDCEQKKQKNGLIIFYQASACLTSEVIDIWSAEAEQAYMKAAGRRADRATKIRLTIEEMLLRFRDLYGTDEPCTIRGIRNFRGLFFELTQCGIQRSPLSIESGMYLPNELLIKMDINPHYVYRNKRNQNVVTIPAPLKPQKHSMLASVLAGVLLSLVTWLLSGYMPEVFLNDYLIPVISGLFSKLSAIFAALATPLVFCAVISGICGLGDISAFGRLGGRFIIRMMFTYFIAMFAMLLIGLPFGIISGYTSVGSENVFSSLLTLVLDIVPNNLVEPFRIDNDMQVIVIAIFIGLILLSLGSKVHQIVSFLNELSTVINRMMLVVCKILPLFVYLGFTNLLLSGKISQLASVSKIVIIFFSASAITITVTVIRTLIVTKKPLKYLLSAQMPSLLINLTTSSQVSALPESMKCCKEKWGIDEKFTDFGLPFGIVFYMPNGAIMLGSMIWVFCAITGNPADVFVLSKIIFVSVIVAIAAPPIPGSAFAVLPILFSACGMDLSMMPLAVLCGATLGYVLPAMNGFCLQLELLMSAWKSDCVKKE